MSLYHHHWLSYYSWCGWCLVDLKTTRQNISWLTGKLEFLYRYIFCDCLLWTSCLYKIKEKKRWRCPCIVFLRSYKFKKKNKQFFVAGDVLCQLPNTGAGTWLNASIRNLGKYSKTAAGMSFNKKKHLFSIWTSSNIVGKTSVFLEIQWRDFRLQNIV